MCLVCCKRLVIMVDVIHVKTCSRLNRHCSCIFVVEMADRPSKLRRLEKFRRTVPHVSANALMSILNEINQHGMPELTHRSNMREARNLTADQATYFGPLLQELNLPQKGDAPSGPLVVSHPFAMLDYTLRTSAPFWDFFRSRLLIFPSTPETPWRVVLYTDEIVPGNVLAPLTLRKCQGMYWTFFEFGPELLCREDLWFCISAKRSSMVTNVEGNMAKIVGELLKLFFPMTGHSLQPEAGGIQFTSGGAHGEVFRLFAVFDMMLQDGGAHKIIWMCKGDAGTKFCLLCKNALALASTMCIDDEPMLRANVLHEHELDFATNADVRGTVARINGYKITDNKGTFKIREQALGITWGPYNLLSDPDLNSVVNPCDQFCHDWMHCLIASGLFQLVFHLLLEDLERAGLRNVYELFQNYVMMCNWQVGYHTSNLGRFFDDTRRTSNRKAGTFKCQASDALALYPVLSFFVLTMFLRTGHAVPACGAFITLCDLLDLFTSCARGVVTPLMMRRRVHLFLDAFVAAFGVQSMIPKCHWLLHFARHLERWGNLLACFVTERKHKMLKRYANDLDNTSHFERSLMAEVVCHQIQALDDPNTFSSAIGLVKPQKAPRKLADVLMAEFQVEYEFVATATTSRFSKFATCSKKDVVLFTKGASYVAGEIWAHADIHGVAVSIVSEWALLEHAAATMSATWTVQQNPVYIATSDILAACVWTRMSHNVVRTFLPTRVTIG
jgi:hypothetical protein